MALGIFWSSIGAVLFLTVLAVDKMGFFSSNNKFPVKGRTVLVTGASQGAGRCTARLLAERGANVIIVARTVSKLKESLSYIAEGALNKETQRFHFISADLTISSETSRVLVEATTWNNGSPLDIVWCVHGSAYPHLFTETPIEFLQSQMQTNYFSNAYVAHAALNAWLQPSSLITARNRQSALEPRHLIFTSSLITFLPIIGYSPYAPAKAALRSLADTLSMEVKLYESTHLPIRVHTVFPATIHSEGFEQEERVKADVTKKLEEGDSPQTPEDVARYSFQALERGDEMVATTLITRLAMAGMFGITRRNGLAVLDMLLSWLAVLVLPIVRMDLTSQVVKWGKENGGKGSKTRN